MNKMNCRQIEIGCCLIMTVLLLAGCGGEYGVSGTSGVSDSAVSSSAVSGQVSDGYSRYTYCSDWNLYYIKDHYWEDARIVERNLKDDSEREIPVEGLHEICYADNDWVYYAKRTETEKEDSEIVGEIWRAPIDKSSCQMDEKAAELVLKEDNNVGMVLSRTHVGIDHSGILCDGRYIVFEGGEWTGPEGIQSLDVFIRVYDIQTGSYVHDKIFRKDVANYSIYNVVLCGDSVFLYDEGADELVRVKLETGEKMTVVPFENYRIDEGHHSWIAAVSEEDIFWHSYEGKKEKIWQYNLAEQKSFCLITAEEIKEMLEDRGLLECSIGGKEHGFNILNNEAYFVHEGRLYAQVEIWGEGSQDVNCYNCVILSKELGKPEAALVYEEKLNECLANPESRQKVFTKKFAGIYGRQPENGKWFFKSRGFCVSMTEDECLMYLENEDEKKNMPACYNFETGTLTFLEKSDGWPSCYLYDRENRILTGDPGEFMEPYDTCDMMPNNYDYEGE